MDPGHKARDDKLMAIIQSKIDPNSEAFRANRRDMLALVENFRALEQRVRDTSNQKLPMFQKRGQLTPRQRLAHLLDRGSPFLEISTLAGLNMHDDDGAENIQGGGVIAGIGYCLGRALRDHGKRLRHQGRHHRAHGPAQEPARAGDRDAQQAALSSRWWSRAAPISTTRPRSSSTAGAPSPTWRACRPWASRT